jgi:tetratricopeptide (TPR) repeat protein
MSLPPSVQPVQVRLAQHYLDRVRRAETAARRGRENRARWLSLIQQDWEQIQHWQAWSAAGKGADPERARLCSRFPAAAAASLRVRLPPAEQFVWVRQALEAAEELADHEAGRALLYELGFLSITLELPDQAERYARELMSQAQAAQDERNLGRAGFLLGAVAFIRGRYDQAESEFTAGLSRLHACRAVEDIGQIWLGLGRVENVRGSYQPAHDYYLKYLQAATAAGNELAVLEAHISLSGIHLALGDFPAAEEHARRAAAMARPLGRSRFLPPALFGLADAERSQGKADRAIAHYTEGLQVARAVSSAPSTIANGLHGLGQSHYLQGEPAEALACFEEGLEVAREAGFLLRVCEISHDMVFVHVARQEPQAARLRLQDALHSARELGTPHFMAKALAAAVVLWRHSGQPEQSAVWAGLLSRHLPQLEPTLFDVAVYAELESDLGSQAYHEALARGERLALDSVISEILASLSQTPA